MSLHKRCSRDPHLPDGRPTPNHCPTSPDCPHVWHYYFSLYGERYRGSTQTADKAQARAAENAARTEAAAGITRPERAVPTDAKAIGPATAVDPLTETDAEIWNRWSRDREIREAVERRRMALANREMAERSIYPIECAQRLAHELKAVAPDWRAARPTLSAAWGQLLRQQPELTPELTRRREAVITALLNNTPPEFHRAIEDLRKLIDLHA